MPGLYTTGYKFFYKNMGSWNNGSYYYPGEYVSYNFITYLCIAAVLNLPAQSPDLATGNWVSIVDGSVTSDFGDRFVTSATSTRGRTIDGFIEKEYLIDYYSSLIPNFTQSGLFLTGYNSYGALGDNTGTSRSSPVQTVAGGNNWKTVSSHLNTTLGIKTDGTLWTWGTNGSGQLGDNTTVDKSSPVQTVTGGNNWKQGIGGNCCVAIKTDGTLWTWGSNSSGQLGDNTTTNKSSPVQTVTGGTNWKSASNAGNRIGAVKLDGSLWLWGSNGNGHLGDNTFVSKSSPVQTVSTGNNWVQVSVGSSVVGAIKTDGTLWVWGYGGSGGLGTNNTNQYSSPVQTVAGGTNWKSFSSSAFDEFATALKTDGTLWGWGINAAGQLGDNTLTNRSSPVQTITGGTDWRSTSSGTNHVAAIKIDGTLWVWGNNAYGQLGDGTFINRSSPVQTYLGGSGWRYAFAGYTLNAAIKDLTDI